MLATACSRLVEVPVTVPLRRHRLWRHAPSRPPSRVPGRVLPLPGECAGGPGRTGSAAPAAVVRGRYRGTRDKRGGTLNAAQESLVYSTRETVVSCISRLILESDKQVRWYCHGRGWLRNQAGFRPMEEFQSNTAENSASKRDAGRKASLTYASRDRAGVGYLNRGEGIAGLRVRPASDPSPEVRDLHVWVPEGPIR